MLEGLTAYRRSEQKTRSTLSDTRDIQELLVHYVQAPDPGAVSRLTGSGQLMPRIGATFDLADAAAHRLVEAGFAPGRILLKPWKSQSPSPGSSLIATKQGDRR